jgi:N utilization substance protein A
MSSMGVSANRMEILQIAKSVAQEKSIDEAVVLSSMEEAIQKAARARYGHELDIRAEINPKSGETRLWRVQTVVEEVTNTSAELTLKDALRIKPDAVIGDTFTEELPPFEFGRVGAQTAKQVIIQKVREAERERQYEEYKDRVGEIINGVIKRVENGNVIVDLGRAEAIIRYHDQLPRENYRIGDRLRAYLYKVSRETKGPQLFLSRAHPQMMAKLFAQEVPEVYQGIIEIKAVSRDPGSRAKIAVLSHDNAIDPVGACVGMRGARVQAVVNELNGEKVDIIPWSMSVPTFIVNALQPAEITRVVLDEEDNRVQAVVADAQFPLAVGRRGQNVRLASQLTGWQIDLVTETQDSERRQKDFADRTAQFMRALDVDETLAQLLASEGFESVEDIAYVEPDELATVGGFDDGITSELQARARDHLERVNVQLDAKRRSLGIEDGIVALPGMTLPLALVLSTHGIKTLEDVAGLTSDELVGYREPTKDGKTVFRPGLLNPKDMTREAADALVLHARVAAGWVDAAALDQLLPQEIAETEVADTPGLEDMDGDELAAALSDDTLLEELDADELAALMAEGAEDGDEADDDAHDASDDAADDDERR